MELIIPTLMLFIFVNCLLKLSFWKLWQTIAFALLAAVFVVWICRYAIHQSKTELNDYMNQVEIMQNVAVLITLESAVCFAFCIAAMRELFGRKIKRWIKPLYAYPGLLVFPVLFYLLTQLIFALPGIEYTKISYGLALCVAIGLPLLSHWIKHLYPEREQRLEVHFLVSLFVCIIGLITTANGDVTYKAVRESFAIKGLVVAFAVFVVAFALGFYWNKVKWGIKQQKDSKNKSH